MGNWYWRDCLRIILNFEDKNVNKEKVAYIMDKIFGIGKSDYTVTNYESEIGDGDLIINGVDVDVLNLEGEEYDSFKNVLSGGFSFDDDMVFDGMPTDTSDEDVYDYGANGDDGDAFKYAFGDTFSIWGIFHFLLGNCWVYSSYDDGSSISGGGLMCELLIHSIGQNRYVEVSTKSDDPYWWLYYGGEMNEYEITLEDVLEEDGYYGYYNGPIFDKQKLLDLISIAKELNKTEFADRVTAFLKENFPD